LEKTLTLTDDEHFVWNTPATRELIRVMMLRAMAHRYRDNVAEPGPQLVDANQKILDLEKRFRKAQAKVWAEMDSELASLLGEQTKPEEFSSE
jgi:hypothetical protein